MRLPWFVYRYAADLGCLAVQHTYVTETTVTTAAHAGESTAPSVQPLWLFVLQFDDGNQAAARSLDVPCGFWSLEANPASIPEDIILDPTPQFEHVGKRKVAPLASWNQVLGNISFTIQTKCAPSSIERLS